MRRSIRNRKHRRRNRSLLLERLEDRRMLATVSWNVEADGFWDVASNWLDDTGVSRLPTAGDDVLLDRQAGDYTITVRSGTQRVNSITSVEDIAITAGTLAVNAASQLSGSLSISGGTLDADGLTTVRDTVSWTGGTIRGTAGLSLTTTAVLNLTGTGTKSLLDSGGITSAGLINHDDGQLTLTGVLNVVTGGTYDVRSDTAAISGTGDLNNAGTFRKSAGTGDTNVAADFNNTSEGIVDVQAGKLTFSDAGSRSTGGVFQVAAGAVLDLTGGSNMTYEGTYTGSGAGTIQVASGRLATTGAGVTFDLPANLFQWVGGEFASNATRPIVNVGVMTLGGSDPKTLLSSAVLTNQGTIIQSGPGGLVGTANAINNQADAVWDLQSDVGMIGTSGSRETIDFNNAGTLRKSGGAGLSEIGANVNNLGGIVDVLSGTLMFSGAGDSTGGTFNVASGARLQLDRDGGNVPDYTGEYTGFGAGRIEHSEGRLRGADAVFNFAAGLFHWTGGELQGSFVNAGVTELSGAGDKNLVDTASFSNRGTVIHSGSGNLIGSRNMITNEAGAIWDFQHDGNATIRGATPASNPGIDFNNAGIVRKTTGGGVSEIEVSFNNLVGTIDVQTGRLLLSGNGNSTGGHFDIAANAVFELGNKSPRRWDIGGQYTGSGEGRVELTGRLGGDDANPAVLNFPEGMFHWIGTATERVSGTLINESFMTLHGDFLIVAGLFTNRGTMVQIDNGLLNLTQNASFNNEGLYDLQGDGDIIQVSAAGGVAKLNNSGVLRKSGGSLSQIQGDIEARFNNTGTIEVSSGTLRLQPLITQFNGTTLTGGTWIANNAVLDLAAVPSITTNQASVTLQGPNSQLAALAALANNQGFLALLDGRDFTTSGDFTNTGTLTIDAGSTLTVNGDFTENSSNTAELIIGGRPATGEFGRVDVTGRANLDGRLRVTLDSGFGPIKDDSYQIMSFAGRDGAPPRIDGLSPFFQATVNDTSVILNVVVDQVADARILPASIGVPATASPGQDVTIRYTVDNLSATAVSGNWTDSVYLSRDSVYDTDDVLIGRVEHTGGLIGLGSYSETLTAPLPPAADGRNHVIVIVDSRRDFPDIDRSNNRAASANRTDVQVPVLPLGTLVQGTIAPGEDRFFRIDVPAGQGDVKIHANFAVANQAEFVARYRDVPTRSVFDQGSDLSKLGRDIMVTSPQAGRYYVLIHGREATAGGETFDIRADLINFEVRSVSPSRGGQGRVSVRIEGAGFTPEARIQLVDGSGTVLRTASPVFEFGTDLEAQDVFVDRNTLVGVWTLSQTFNDPPVPPGLYDVQVIDVKGTSTLRNAFEVEPPENTLTSFGGLEFELIVPEFFRSGRAGVLRVEYENTSNVDIPVPFFLFTSDISCMRPFRILASSGGGGGPIPIPREPSNEECRGFYQNQVVPEDTYITLMGPLSKTGSPLFLAPGETGSIDVPFLPQKTGPDITTELSVQPILGNALIPAFSLREALRPPGVDDDGWNAVWENFLDGVEAGFFDGELVIVYGNLLRVLQQNAAYLQLIGVETNDIARLMAFEIGQASNFGEVLRRYHLGPLGRGQDVFFDVRAGAQENGDVFITRGSGVRGFLFDEDSGTFTSGQRSDFATLTRLELGGWVLREINGIVAVFSAEGNLSHVEDPNGVRVTLTYTDGHVTSLTDTFGNMTAIEYNADGFISQITDPVGGVTTFTYDETGERLATATDIRGTTSYTYVTGDGARREHAVASMTLPDGAQFFFEYNERGELLRTARNGDSQPLAFVYDTAGQVEITNALGHTTTLLRNEFGNPARITDPLGRTTTQLFDERGLLTGLTAPQGVQTTLSRDAFGNMISLVDSLGHETEFGYEPTFQRLTMLRDARGNTTHFNHDARGNTTRVVNPAGEVEQAFYDAHGNLVRVVNRRGQSVTLMYNADNLLIREELDDGSAVDFTYDAHRNLSSATDKSGVSMFEHDPADRLTRITYPTGRSLEYAYNEQGRRTRMEDQDGFAQNYAYDALGRLSQVTDGDGDLIVEYEYDDVGRLARRTLANGVLTEYNYDAAWQLTSVVTTDPSGGVLSSYDYVYDSLGHRTSVTTLEGATEYGYDALGQLTQVILPGGRAITYEYDAVSNRIAVQDDGATTGYTANDLNQYTAVGGATFEYDADGNLIARTEAGVTTRYEYDERGRLVDVHTPADVWNYEYDVLGNRTAVVHNGERTEYLIDPIGLGNIVAEYDSDGNLIGRDIHALGLVSRIGAAGEAGFYTFDAQGNTSELTDGSGGVLEQLAYLPFGEKLAGPDKGGNPFTFVGAFGVLDGEDGLYFMRNRSYDASIGRFLQLDPIRYNGNDLNLYRYANNAPTQRIDPLGLQTVDIGIAGGAPNIVGGTGGIQVSGDGVFFYAGGGLSSPGAGGAVLFNNSTPTPGLSRATQAAFGIAGSRSLQLSGPNSGDVTWSGGVGLGIGGSKAQGYGEFLVLTSPGFYIPLPESWIKGFGDQVWGVDSTEWGTDLQRVLTSPCVTVYLANIRAQGGQVDEEAITNAVKHCGDEARRKDAESKGRQSGDPNDITGPAGFGDEKFIDPALTFPYLIRFENMPTATAPAQEVFITQQLDDDFDWSTFELGEVGFGSFVLPIPEGSSSVQQQYDFTNELGLILDFEAGIDTTTGMAHWTFRSLDPDTGDLLADVFGGFLPPNVTPPDGDGFVSYTVRPKTSLATGTRFDAEATIVFDVNEPIDTPAIFNTVDADAPTSSVLPLDAETYTTDFTVAWSGEDGVGAGVEVFDVFVSTDGGPFEIWLAGTPDTTGTFTGEFGRMYAFFSAATDAVGHREAVRLLPDTQTTLNGRPWHNVRNPLDVDGDGHVSPVDALVNVNLLNRVGAHVLPIPSAGVVPPPFRDVNDDGSVSPIDVLLVVNFLNQTRSGERGEGDPIPESVPRFAVAPTLAAGTDSGRPSRIAEIVAVERADVDATPRAVSGTQPVRRQGAIDVNHDHLELFDLDALDAVFRDWDPWSELLLSEAK